MKHRNILVLVILLAAGFVIGGLIAQVTKNTAALSWLSYGTALGIDPSKPFLLDAAFLKLSFGFELTINVAEAVFMVGAVFLYRKF